MLQAIQETAAWIKSHTALRPETAIVLGTGLGRLAEEIEIVDAFPYNEIPHFPVSTVEGHSGRLLFGRLGGKEVMALEGRFHYYEGYTMKEVTYPERVMHELGIKNFFVSNASGGVNPDFEIGDMMLITDHILLPRQTPWLLWRWRSGFHRQRRVGIPHRLLSSAWQGNVQVRQRAHRHELPSRHPSGSHTPG